MKIIHVLLVSITMLTLLGCEPKTESKQVQVLQVPDLGGYTILAYMDEKNKVVTLYKGAGVVCIENAIHKYPATGNNAAFSCWDVDVAPQKLQVLTKNYKEMKYVPIQ